MQRCDHCKNAKIKSGELAWRDLRNNRDRHNATSIGHHLECGLGTGNRPGRSPTDGALRAIPVAVFRGMVQHRTAIEAGDRLLRTARQRALRHFSDRGREATGVTPNLAKFRDQRGDGRQGDNCDVGSAASHRHQPFARTCAETVAFRHDSSSAVSRTERRQCKREIKRRAPHPFLFLRGCLLFRRLFCGFLLDCFLSGSRGRRLGSTPASAFGRRTACGPFGQQRQGFL